MTTLKVNGSETGVLRLFHIDLPREAVSRFVAEAGTGEWPLKYALGATALKGRFVDTVDLRDLEKMALSQYMAEAHGAAGPEFRAEKPKIDALKGHVLLLPSQAFAGISQTLSVASPLRYIGTYGEARAKPAGKPLESASAKGTLSGAPGTGRPDRSPLLRLVLIGVVVLAVLVIAMALR